MEEQHQRVQYQPRDFITHVVYYADSQIALDRTYMEGQLGIQCIEVPSQKRADGRPSKFCEQDVRWALTQLSRDK